MNVLEFCHIPFRYIQPPKKKCLKFLHHYIAQNSKLLPETNSSHLKMDGWSTSFFSRWPIFRCQLLVSGSVSFIATLLFLRVNSVMFIPEFTVQNALNIKAPGVDLNVRPPNISPDVEKKYFSCGNDYKKSIFFI